MTKIGAIILAAGMSSRMGEPKLLLLLKEKPLFRYSVELAIRLQLDPIVLIGGEYMDVFQSLTAEIDGIEFIKNKDYMDGMSSSLKLGIEKIKNRVDAVVIFLADQPFVPDFVVQSLIQDYKMERQKGIHIIRPQYNVNLGHPILIDRSLFSEFLNLEGDQGGKEIIKKYKAKTKIRVFEPSFWGMDIDTAEDYKKANTIVNGKQRLF
ncbi:nucleotidyltransferase family protein [Neobacillus niacini]|uniref:nucleotidyltransferase family protein n=1 Tax=Neobacillus niacini TaxID=86668 RepID=UPI002860D948|nr:nucleotidyltransferase family protein [Neobacillus niacini]MDR6997594.1 molybdenum cofactor cytidylyltransferase [Neobacillus niacini]